MVMLGFQGSCTSLFRGASPVKSHGDFWLRSPASGLVRLWTKQWWKHRRWPMQRTAAQPTPGFMTTLQRIYGSPFMRYLGQLNKRQAPGVGWYGLNNSCYIYNNIYIYGKTNLEFLEVLVLGYAGLLVSAQLLFGPPSLIEEALPAARRAVVWSEFAGSGMMTVSWDETG